MSPKETASTWKPGSETAPSVQKRKPTSAPAGTSARLAVRSTHSAPVLPVMPWPKFWPWGSAVVDRSVGRDLSVVPPSVE